MKTNQNTPPAGTTHAHRISSVFEGGSAYCACGQFMGPGVRRRPGEIKFAPVITRLRTAA